MTRLPSDSSGTHRLHTLLACAGLIILVALVFHDTLNGEFLNWDDDKSITGNILIRQLSIENVKILLDIGNGDYYQQFPFVKCQYMPLVMLSFAVDYHFFGLSPAAFHSTSLILHILNSLCVFWLIVLLSKNTITAFLTALFFGVHPLHVESVAWVSQRKDLLYGFFFLLSLVFYVYHAKKANYVFLTCSLVFFLFSFLSKAAALPLPFVLILIDYLLKRKFGRSIVMEKLPYFLLLIVFIYISHVVHMHWDNNSQRESSTTLFYNMFIASYGLVLYISKTITPVNLSHIYPRPAALIYSQLPAMYLLSPFIVLAAFYLTARYARMSRVVMFGSLFFLMMILPFIQLFVIIAPGVAADRYTYIPLIGIFFIMASGISYLCQVRYVDSIKQRAAVISAVAIVIGLFSWLSYERCKVWKDGISLWSDYLQKYPAVLIGYDSRGDAYLKKGRYQEAIQDFTFVIFNNPESIPSYLNRGNAYFHLKNYRKAISDYDKVIHSRPDFAMAYNNRAMAYDGMGDLDKALADYSRAINISGSYENALANRAHLYERKGDYGNAIMDYTRILGINPDNALILACRAVMYFKIKDYGRAALDAERAQALGFTVDANFLEDLHKARGAPP